MKRVTLISPAEQELADAMRFYESRSTGLGKQFLIAFERCVVDISQHPGRWPELRPGLRRRHIARFPYSLVYRDLGDRLQVVAVAHQHRRPDYYVERIG